jgi:hypothetical protein
MEEKERRQCWCLFVEDEADDDVDGSRMERCR